MAQKTEPAPIGTRLAALREARGLTAQQLADRVAGSGITRVMITNVENGRKRDLTVTEALQLASGLGVPIWALLVDTSNPWSLVELPGVSTAENGTTVIDMVMGSVGVVFGHDVGQIPYVIQILVETSIETKRLLLEFTAKAAEAEQEVLGDAWEPGGEGRIFVPDGYIDEKPYLEPARHYYRLACEAAIAAKAALEMIDSGISVSGAAADVPPGVRKFVNELGDLVLLAAVFFRDDLTQERLRKVASTKQGANLWGWGQDVQTS